MRSLNRDTLIAVFLLVFCALLAWSSLYIREPGYGTLKPSTWPRIVVIVLALLSLVYFFQSLASGPDIADRQRPPGLAGFFDYYRNPIFCFVIYFVFLLTLPWIGALIGGILLVFALLTVLGGWTPGDLLRHAIISIVSMGFMWALFTFALKVILPEGEIFSIR